MAAEPPVWFKFNASKREFCILNESAETIKWRLRYGTAIYNDRPEDLEKTSNWTRTSPEQPAPTGPIGFPYGFVV